MGGFKMLMNTTFFVIYPILKAPTRASQGESGSPREGQAKRSLFCNRNTLNMKLIENEWYVL